ncbi:UNVERIFIED_CONTAM: hypothetical protein Scaly_3152000 [Sesamum calycinum]|uniref:Retrotransposon gag protein n=1 Tax=Sesamum calycinum TaxID=2727403 RepID=A0AAW2JF51_9LAMI
MKYFDQSNNAPQSKIPANQTAPCGAIAYTIKLALTNFGTPSGTIYPSSSSLIKKEKTLHGYSRKSCEAGKFQTRHIKVFKFKYQSVGVTTRNMSKKLKESSQMSPLAEGKLADLTRAIEGLMKHVQEQDAQIARLINKADNIDASHVMEKQVEAHDEVEMPIKQHYAEKDKSAKEFKFLLTGLIPVDQLKEFIEGTIRSKVEGSSRSSFTYSKPYTPRIDSLKMPIGYQPPKFQQFDGKGNPKQHVAHFVETCNNVGTYGDHLVKQFVRSLKDNAFDRYTDLEAGSINGWEHLEQEFLNCFYNTRRIVSMVELTILVNGKKNQSLTTSIELEKKEPSKGRLQNSLYVPQVTELEKKEPSKGRLQNSLYAIPQMTELEKKAKQGKIAKFPLSSHQIPVKTIAFNLGLLGWAVLNTDESILFATCEPNGVAWDCWPIRCCIGKRKTVTTRHNDKLEASSRIILRSSIGDEDAQLDFYMRV